MRLIGVEHSLKLVIGDTKGRANVSQATKHLVTEGLVAVKHGLAHGLIVAKELLRDGTGGSNKRLSDSTYSGVHLTNVRGNLTSSRTQSLEDLCKGRKKKICRFAPSMTGELE